MCPKSKDILTMVLPPNSMLARWNHARLVWVIIGVRMCLFSDLGSNAYFLFTYSDITHRPFLARASAARRSCSSMSVASHG